MAGESAHEAARLLRAKGEHLQRSADLWERGAVGEQTTAEVLSALPGQIWTVFHDVRWPGRPRANVDHVAVGPAGVFVIDSKNWSGSVTVRDNVLRQNGRSRESAVASAAEAALAVTQVVPVVMPQHVYPVLCFVRDEPLTGWARDVIVSSTANIVHMLSTRPAVLPPHVAQEACLQLDAMFRSAAGPAATDTRALRAPRGSRGWRPAPTRPVIARSVRSRRVGPPVFGPVRPTAQRRVPPRRPPRVTAPKRTWVVLAVLVVIMMNPELITAFSQGIAMLVQTLLQNSSGGIAPVK